MEVAMLMELEGAITSATGPQIHSNRQIFSSGKGLLAEEWR
jgi:hypothetical protein